MKSKLKALQDLIKQMLKREASEHGEEPMEESSDDVSPEVLEPDMREMHEPSDEDVAESVDELTDDKKSFFKRGNKMPSKGRMSAMLLTAEAKPKKKVMGFK